MISKSPLLAKDILKEARKRRKLTLSQAAIVTKIKASTLSRYENGNRKISADDFISILGYYSAHIAIIEADFLLT